LARHGGLRREQLQQGPLLDVGVLAAAGAVDAEHAEQGAVMGEHRREEGILGMPAVRVGDGRCLRRPRHHALEQLGASPVVEVQQRAPPLAVLEQTVPQASGVDRAEHLGHLGGPDRGVDAEIPLRGHHVDDRHSEIEGVDHALGDLVEGVAQAGAGPEAPHHAEHPHHGRPAYPGGQHIGRVGPNAVAGGARGAAGGVSLLRRHVSLLAGGRRSQCGRSAAIRDHRRRI
jgi:hypothetical protein